MEFTFIRPLWLLLLIPLGLVVWRLFKVRRESGMWHRVVDPLLIPHVLKRKITGQSSTPVVLFAIAAFIVILALSGPAFRKYPQPVYLTQKPLIILLDLSPSMNATDVKPDRLKRAKLKLIDLLKLRREGQTALIAYSSAPFVVTPMTLDVDTVELLINNIDTNVVPVKGSRLDHALQKAMDLLKNTASKSGDVLVVADSVDGASVHEKARQLLSRNVRVSVMAVGTQSGAPIRTPSGGFYLHNGAVVVPRVDLGAMRGVADSGGGRFVQMTHDDSDIRYLAEFFKPKDKKEDPIKTEYSSKQWIDDGHWLLLGLLPLAAFAFRKGWVMVLVLAITPFGYQQGAYAFTWDDLWQNRDQQGADAYEKQKYKEAEKLFKDKDWSAAAKYKNKKYDEVLKHYEKKDDSDGHYNRGNTLAHMGRFREAIQAYEEALKKNKKNKDAQYNLDLLKKYMRKQQRSGQGQGGQSGQQGNSSGQSGGGNQQGQSGQSGSQGGQQGGNQGNQNNNQNQQGQNGNQQGQQNQSGQNGQQNQQANGQNSQNNGQDQGSGLTGLDKQKLSRLKDDPGSLLRNKFSRQYKSERHRYEDGHKGNEW